MKNIIPEETIFKLAEASITSSFRIHVANAVTQHFRSMHYLSSKLLCDCIVLNLLLNNDITPISADEIITHIRRRTKSFYTTVENAFFPIEDKFEEYAKSVLGDNYNAVKQSGISKTNYIVFVISYDLHNNHKLYPQEVYAIAYPYTQDVTEYPHY